MRPVRRVSVINRNVNSATVNNGSNIRSTVFPEGMNLNYMRNFQSDSNYPKHISISYSSSDNFLIYETVVLLYSLSAFLLQLLHLYRTVWWLPQSYENNAMKFYLVNPYLVGFVLTIIIPRWLWTCCSALIVSIFPQSLQEGARQFFQIILLIMLGIVHFYFSFMVYSEELTEDKQHNDKTHPIIRIGCLIYPTFIMVANYQKEIKNYLELVPNSGASDFQDSVSTNLPVPPQLQHKCSNDPAQVRREAEILTKDFNRRIRNALFHSHIVAITCTLLPCCLVQTFVHFDVHVAIQHFILVWIGSLTLNAVHAFPPKYCDVLHSSARHLGCWDYIGSNTGSNVLYDEWCPRTVWKQGSIVCFDDAIYRARGDLNSAEPGSAHHKRFYLLFINAAVFQISLLVIQLAVVLLQLVLLLKSSEWYQMISLSLLQASGGYALFKLMRDTVVVWRLSLAEEILKTS